ncbi:hypothetical protein ACLMJK_007033 [Lecanora helva]
MTLYYTFTSWFTYKAKIAALLVSSKRIIAEQILLNGRDGKLLVGSDGQQSFWNSVQNGFEVRVANIKPDLITWGNLQDLFYGLTRRCWLQTSEFEFSVGGGFHIGRGSLSKV